MRSLSSAELSHLQARAGTRFRVLVWIRVRNISSGLVEAVGFWSGEDDRTFTIGAETRTYHGAGVLLGIDDLTL